ncbi:MAG: LysR substrate-binding domain-containing protein [Vulcanimicrobiaceae bacterium]
MAVAHERHFGRAAERCNVSQAALSEQIRKLEALLGVTLFERTKRRVDVTPRGEPLIRQAEALLGDARRFVESARRSAEPLTGDLRLGVIATLGPYYLPALLREGRERFPRLALRIREALTDDLLGALRRGELDAALVALPIAEDALSVEPLFFEPFYLACPIDHPLATAPTVRLCDLPRAQLLLMEDGHCLRDQTLALCDRRRLDPHTRFASSLEMLRHMIAAGEGYSVLPQMAAYDASNASPLVHYRPLLEADAGRTIALVWRSSETRVDDLVAVAAFLRASAPDALRTAESGARSVA